MNPRYLVHIISGNVYRLWKITLAWSQRQEKFRNVDQSRNILLREEPKSSYET